LPAARLLVWIACLRLQLLSNRLALQTRARAGLLLCPSEASGEGAAGCGSVICRSFPAGDGVAVEKE
jgi:hypothetical protein